MKKTASVLGLFALSLFLVCCALAEAEFPLRSDIHFGDTMEDILSKEKTLVRESDESNIFLGTIAGYENSTCSFFFDDDNRLTGMNYSFDRDNCSDRDSTNDVYKTLYQGLCRKYGDPIGNTGGTVELITGPAFDRMALIVYGLGAMDGCSADYMDYDEWVVDTDTYHVKIDMTSYYLRNSSADTLYLVDVSYQKYTDEDFENALAAKQNERDTVDNDL